jgi:hypothetical protein
MNLRQEVALCGNLFRNTCIYGRAVSLLKVDKSTAELADINISWQFLVEHKHHTLLEMRGIRCQT